MPIRPGQRRNPPVIDREDALRRGGGGVFTGAPPPPRSITERTVRNVDGTAVQPGQDVSGIDLEPSSFTPRTPEESWIDTSSYDPDAPKITDELQQEYYGLIEEPVSRAMGELGVYNDLLGGIGAGYEDMVLGSDPYAQLQTDRDAMRGIYEQGGLTDVTRAGLESNRRSEDQWIRAQREAMMQDLAERGVTGGGYEIAGAIGDRAAAADRMSARDLETQAFAQEQALGALRDSNRMTDDLFGYNRGVANVKADLGRLGADAYKGISDMVLDSGMGVAGNLVRQTIDASRSAYESAAGDAAGAGDRVAGILGGASESNIDRGTSLVGGDKASNDTYGGNLYGSIPSTTPMAGGEYLEPPQSANWQPAIDAGFGAVEGIANLFGGNNGIQGGGTGGGGSGGGGTAGGGSSSFTFGESDVFGDEEDDQ